MKSFTISKIDRHTTYLVLSLKPNRPKDRLHFMPGQYATISFKKAGRLSPMRCFSMVSSPDEPNQLQFAMRVTGNFTQTLSRLKIGTSVKLQGPYGEFVIDPDYDRNIVLMAGGIGITPFISMLRQAASSQSSIPITLLFGCRNQADIPFYDEIIALEKANPKFKAVFFVNDGNIDKQKAGLFVPGRVDEDRLQQITQGHFDRFSFFICGPNIFRQSLQSVLQAKGVEQTKIVTESFTQGNQLSSFMGFSVSSLAYGLSGLALVGLTAFIMVIDLARIVPKVSAANKPAASTTDAAAAAASAADTNTTSGSNTPAATPTPTTPTTNSTATPSNNSYQSPVSSVS